jgi:hypothetical protein
MIRFRIAAACAGVLVLVLSAPASARVPATFFGVDAGEPLFSGRLNDARQFNAMVSAGVQSIRVVFSWAASQPYARWADVPAVQRGRFVDRHGVPTSFAATDRIVGLAADHGLTVLPCVLYAPAWDLGLNRSGGFSPPRLADPYGAYLKALIGRYGPHGTFWREGQRKLPIRMWQVWNEPNLSGYWPQPFARSYVRLLRVAHTAIKRVDPAAKVVLGALTNAAWVYLRQIYRVQGARKLFDVISVNPYTATPADVLLYLQYVRRAANRLGDRNKPILASEVSWPTAEGRPVRQSTWDTTEPGQARNIQTLLPMLAANHTPLKLDGFYYYTWITEEDFATTDDFNYAGLLRSLRSGRVIAKPGLGAYRRAALAAEGCSRKLTTATRCG